MTLAAITSVLSRTPASLIPTIERYLYGNQRSQLNRLGAAMTNVATTATMSFDMDGVRPGAYVEVDDEIMYVWSVATDIATVERGMLGSTAAAHLTSAMVRVEPRFFRAEMTEEISKEIRSWPTGLYARYMGDLAIGADTSAIDLAGMLGINGAQLLRVQLSPMASYLERWNRVDGARLERRQQSTAFPSGYGLVIPREVGEAGTLRVVVRAPFNAGALAAATDLGSIGLTHDQADIIPWGVAARLLMTRDVARTDASSQGRSRPAEEVRTGDASEIANRLMQQRERMLIEAGNRLLAEDGMGWA